MTDRVIFQKYRQVFAFVEKKQLAEAFELLSEMLNEASDWLLNNNYNQLRETYSKMLSFAIQGVVDPQRDEIYAHIVDEICTLADSVKEALLLRFSQRLPYQRMRYSSFASVADLCQNCEKMKGVELEAAERRLFDFIWLSKRWSEMENAKILLDFVEQEKANERTRCLIVSAATLSLLRLYDRQKVDFLLSTCRSENVVVRQRAVVGTLLALAFYANRIAGDKAIMSQLSVFVDDEHFRSELRSAFLLLVRTSETQAVTDRIRNDIMPAMMRATPKISDKLSEILSRDDDDQDEMPDLEQLLDEAGVSDKMQEFSEMQLDGSDVYAATFSNLKSYPFFGELANWLIPFDASHSSVAEVLDGASNIFANIVNMPFMCNSDKYSFCLTLAQMPAGQRRVMVDGVNAEVDDVNEMLKDEVVTRPNAEVQTVANQYVQDLYRLYTLHPNRADFENPLESVWAFYRTDIFRKIFPENSVRKSIANYYYSKKLYSDAIPQFRLLDDFEKDAEVLQKLGYCYKKMGDYEMAENYYSLADVIQPDNFLILRHLAQCQRRLGLTEKALQNYTHCAQLQPENFKILMQKGHCLVELKRYAEAIETYFCADNLKPDEPSCRRAVAWCYLLDNQFAKAIRQYEKLTASEPQCYDLLNMAHACFLDGQRERAFDCYQQSLKKYENRKEFFEALAADRQTLIDLGISEDDFLTITESLKLL